MKASMITSCLITDINQNSTSNDYQTFFETEYSSLL